jgi:hypothetical protein
MAVAKLPLPGVTVESYTVTRSGVLELPVTGAWHCGPKSSVKPDGTVTVRFNLRVTCDPGLDERGFLFDQHAVTRWLTDAVDGPTDMSCELLARELGLVFVRHVHETSPGTRIRYLYLELSPDPFAATFSTTFDVRY